MSGNFVVCDRPPYGWCNGLMFPDSEIEEYNIMKLTSDIIAIADYLEFESFHLIGHDWGAAVGWVLSSMCKDKIITYSALSVPHLDAFSNAISNNKIQKKKSYYILIQRHF